MALYPDKPIYDVPGITRCTGRELTQSLLAQAAPFLSTTTDDVVSSHLHLGQMVETLERGLDGWRVTTSSGVSLQARSLFITAGAGAFVPRSLQGVDLKAYTNVSYHLDESGLAQYANQHVVVAGGGDEAMLAVLALCNTPIEQRARQVTLLHRRDVFQADEVIESQVLQLLAEGTLALRVGMPTDVQGDQAGRLQALVILQPDGQPTALELDQLIIQQGMSPKLGPLTTWGLTLDRKQVTVNTSTFETNLPQVYAVGDINTYAAKKRLLVCGFHEATMAAHAAAAALSPDAPTHLLYTTTSPLLHARLGVTASRKIT